MGTESQYGERRSFGRRPEENSLTFIDIFWLEAGFMFSQGAPPVYKRRLEINLLICFIFAFSRDASDLREFWRIEVIRKNRFSWRRLLTNKANWRRNFLFWWRLASEMHKHGSKRHQKIASGICRKLRATYAADVELGAVIGPGLHMPHHTGIVISKRARIGSNFTIRQNTTIGGVKGMAEKAVITIGDNVDIGANSCLIGPVTIGDNVTIGAMSFVNNDILADSVYITHKTSTATIRPTCQF